MGGRGPPPGAMGGMGGRGGMGAQRMGIEGDKWQRGLQPPPPPPGMQGGAPGGRGMPGGGYAPTAKLHKSDKRYVVRPRPFCSLAGWRCCAAARRGWCGPHAR